ncbi:hypothetical protein ACJMK2_008868 [Sinanodonta woodiana]|uniref:Large ribosomal subunit protein uL3m n=1 Tax=Sinanodonta woodiana TaxID=1069815 RepID=A0ABD3VBP0_SINWO
MAAFCIRSMLLRNLTCQNLISADPTLTSRVLVCHQQVRGRRRTCKPPSWFSKRRVSIKQDITPENAKFIKDVIIETYKKPESPLKDGPWSRGTWTPRTQRTGVLAIKLGMLPQWTKDGKKFITTLLQVLDNHVINYTPPDEFAKSMGWKPYWGSKYGSVVVGALSCEPHLFSKSYNNLFAKAGVPPKRKLTRFLVTPDAAIQPGTPLNVMHFRIGDYVDCSAKTIGHGFQGVMKRWGMKGGPATHGCTKAHRRMGSMGGGRDKAGVWKGKRMPGHMGMDWRIVKGLKIWRIDTKYNVLYVTGYSVPGPTHGYVRVYDTVLKHKREHLIENGNPPPMPTFYPEDGKEPIPEEYLDDELFNFNNESISYATEK